MELKFLHKTFYNSQFMICNRNSRNNYNIEAWVDIPQYIFIPFYDKKRAMQLAEYKVYIHKCFTAISIKVTVDGTQVSPPMATGKGNIISSTEGNRTIFKKIGICKEIIYKDVFRILSSICDGTFLWKYLCLWKTKIYLCNTSNHTLH